MFSPTLESGDSDSLSGILDMKPHFKATDLAWSFSRTELRERLSNEAMTCLTLLLDEIGSVPLETIPHADLLPLLVEQGLVEDCTVATQRARIEKLFGNKQPDQAQAAS